MKVQHTMFNEKCNVQPSLLPDVTAVQDGIEFLPQDILIGAVKYADVAREKGRMIPQDEVFDKLKERLGWK